MKIQRKSFYNNWVCRLSDGHLVICSAASALKFLREKNVVHMDLKPKNILLSSDHNPCLKLAGNRGMILFT